MKKLWLLLVMCLWLATIVQGVSYERKMPETVSPGTDFNIIHTFSGIDLSINHTKPKDMGVTEEFSNSFNLKEYKLVGHDENISSYEIKEGVHRWILEPKESTLTLTITLTSPSEEKEYDFASKAVYPPGEIKNTDGKISVKLECTEDDKESCWDESVIVKKQCIEGLWKNTGQSCPPKDCESDLTESCWDGTFVTKKICEKGRWASEPNEQCPEPECTIDVLKECRNGTNITIQRCENGRLIDTEEKCSKTSTLELQIVIIIILALSFWLYKKRKKEEDEEDPEFNEEDDTGQ